MTFSLTSRRLCCGLGLALLSVVALLGCGGSTSALDPFIPTHMVVFGDELSLLDDSASPGNASHYSINALDATDTTNSTVSCSDVSQRIWVQTLAANWGMVFKECNPSGVPANQLKAVMRAQYGATAQTLEQQVAKHEADLENGFDSNGIVTVLVGLHDVMQVYKDDANYPTEDAKSAELDSRGRRVAAQVNHIAKLGPRVLVSKIYSLGLTPYASSQGDAALLTRLTSSFNVGLSLGLINDGSMIGLVALGDLVASLNKSSRYNHFDLACDADHVNVDAYFGDNITTTGNLLGCTTATLTSDSALTTYMWADSLHISHLVQQLLASSAATRASRNPF